MTLATVLFNKSVSSLKNVFFLKMGHKWQSHSSDSLQFEFESFPANLFDFVFEPNLPCVQILESES